MSLTAAGGLETEATVALVVTFEMKKSLFPAKAMYSPLGEKAAA